MTMSTIWGQYTEHLLLASGTKPPPQLQAKGAW